MMTANAVIQWLEAQGAPPLKASVREWKSAALLVMAQLRVARKEIAEGAGWESFEALERGYYKMTALEQLQSLLSYQRTSAEEKEAEAQGRDVRARYDQFWRGCARHKCMHVMRGWLARKKNALEKQSQKRVEEMVRYICDTRDSYVQRKKKKDAQQTELKIARLEKQYFKRSEQWVQQQKNAPFVLSSREMRALPPLLRKYCREYAQQIGSNKPCLPILGSGALEITQYLSNPQRRLAAQNALCPAITSAEHVSATVTERTRRERHEGFTSFSHACLDGAAISSPRKIRGIIAEGVEIAAPAINRFYKASEELHATLGHKARKTTIDGGWSVTQLLQSQGIDGLAYGKAFPVEKTLRKAIPELVSCGQWKAGKPQRIKGARVDGLLWPLTHADGREADLLIFPSIEPSGENAMSAGAEAMMVRGYRMPGEAPRRPLASIQIFSSAKRAYFSVEDLVMLSHEVGHALHGFAPSTEEDVADGMFSFGWDFVEFPSQLLQVYAHDPRVLARWSDQKDEQWKSVSFWKQILQASKADLPYIGRQWLKAWNDISVHSVTHLDPDVQQLYQKSLQRFGLPEDYEPGLAVSSFCWDSYAGQWFAYPLGKALAYYMTPLKSDGTVDARELRRVMQSLLQEVLAEGYSPSRFRKKMEAWTGQKFETLVRSAAKGYMRQYRNDLVSTAAQLRALARSIN